MEQEGNAPICIICQYSLNHTNRLGKPNCCNHKFCFKCIKEWAQYNPICPVDRQPFELIEVFENDLYCYSEAINRSRQEDRQINFFFRPPRRFRHELARARQLIGNGRRRHRLSTNNGGDLNNIHQWENIFPTNNLLPTNEELNNNLLANTPLLFPSLRRQ